MRGGVPGPAWRGLAALLPLASLLAAGHARAGALPALPPTPPRLGSCGADAGGFRLPGTDGCLRIGGFVAAEGGWALASPDVSLAHPRALASRPAAGPDLSHAALGVGTRLTADVRLPTDYGPVRVFMSLRARNGSDADRATR